MTPTKYRMDRIIVLHNSKAYVTQLSKEKTDCIGTLRRRARQRYSDFADISNPSYRIEEKTLPLQA
ncbi:hypothetical protein P5673_010887 [Acropora cervicornis]|uniref:Uncharacterized protein n=1 Tax=Acropora cervicornis TaxID=6130 RepID=A0AAD9V8Z2_ACRCE|nr:hypothetical protein P5673_010887 [Acropora cervicornis]